MPTTAVVVMYELVLVPVASCLAASKIFFREIDGLWVAVFIGS